MIFLRKLSDRGRADVPTQGEAACAFDGHKATDKGTRDQVILPRVRWTDLRQLWVHRRTMIAFVVILEDEFPICLYIIDDASRRLENGQVPTFELVQQRLERMLKGFGGFG